MNIYDNIIVRILLLILLVLILLGVFRLISIIIELPEKSKRKRMRSKTIRNKKRSQATETVTMKKHKELDKSKKQERINSLKKLQNLDFEECKKELLSMQQLCGYNIGGIRQSFLKWRETTSSKEAAMEKLTSIFGKSDVADTIYNFGGGHTYDSQEELNKLSNELLESMDKFERDCLRNIPVGYLPVRGLRGLNTTAAIKHEDKYFIIRDHSKSS